MQTTEDEGARVAALTKEGERLDTLMRDDMRILQRPDGFCFGMDSVLLASFAASRRGVVCAADLGTGSGVLPLLICARLEGVTFDAVELQPDIADMASRSVRICRMESRIRVHSLDLRDAPRALGHGQYGLVVCNPPYGRRGGGVENLSRERHTARHEGEAGISDICAAAAGLLKNGGRFDAVFPAQRLLELLDAMRAARIEPKRVLLVHPKVGKAPNLALVEGVRGAQAALHFLPPLYVRDEMGNETEALKGMYRW